MPSSRVVLNALPAQATVYYPFHHLHGQTFPTVQRSGGRSRGITLELAPGRTLSVPRWMLEPAAQELHLADQTLFPAVVLLNVVALLDSIRCAVAESGNAQE